jgi:hypothetical protein
MQDVPGVKGYDVLSAGAVERDVLGAGAFRPAAPKDELDITSLERARRDGRGE